MQRIRRLVFPNESLLLFEEANVIGARSPVQGRQQRRRVQGKDANALLVGTPAQRGQWRQRNTGKGLARSRQVHQRSAGKGAGSVACHVTSGIAKDRNHRVWGDEASIWRAKMPARRGRYACAKTKMTSSMSGRAQGRPTRQAVLPETTRMMPSMSSSIGRWTPWCTVCTPRVL